MCESCVVMRYICIFCFLCSAGNEKEQLLNISLKNQIVGFITQYLQ